MAVGPLVKKFTWLLDNVEVKGRVRALERDNFALEPDENYKHLISSMRGNNPLPWHHSGFPGCIHCETTLNEGKGLTTDPDIINRLEPWPLGPQPEDKDLEVTNPREPLKIGDHIRVVGRWVIDHHPEYCLLPEKEKWDPPEPQRCRSRGFLQIGPAHVELHPIEWDNIMLVTDLKPSDAQTETLSLAA